jgi:hypothetical protein
MTGFAVLLLFGTGFTLAVWTLFASIRPQLHRFAELVRPEPALPGLPPRLSRVTVRSVPARMPIRPALRAAA